MWAITHLGRLFPRSDLEESVATTTRFAAPPGALWERLLPEHEPPLRPPALLRLLLPAHAHSRGEKTRVGAILECTFDGGYLEKRITAAKPPRLLRFDILVQQLGVEDCVAMRGGSYEITAAQGGSELVLTTRYSGHLQPRAVWRPLERYLGRKLHHHILDGMRDSLRATVRLSEVPAVASPARPSQARPAEPAVSRFRERV